MENSFANAKLKENNLIQVVLYSLKDLNINSISLLVNNEKVLLLKIVKFTKKDNHFEYICKANEEIILGNSYKIYIRDFDLIPLNVSDATSFKDFDSKYFYNKEDLGCSYYKEYSIFKIWAPLASSVVLAIKKMDEKSYSFLALKREDKGVYSIKVDGDLDNYLYHYIVTNNEIAYVTNDPYAKGSLANGKDNVVIDFNKTKIDLHLEDLPILRKNSDAIVYELDIRDFTVDKSTNIVHKGKYLGLCEENRKTKNNNPAGLDYLKLINITHVQILPMYDFKTIDEENIEKTYNWGYDPSQYFVPEGSYSTNPNDGYSRIIELKEMISALHKNKIKVNMDVVFNHVYEYEFSAFEKVVPNYYFRKTCDGRLSNDSFCGNDLDTKRPMVRKLILDAIKFWMLEYGIDGFRFDLLGLIDIETSREVAKLVKSIKPDAMIYGEGWDMGVALKKEERTSYLNSFDIKNVGFFNDTFRDLVRGNGYENGYLLGNVDKIEEFKYCFVGSSFEYHLPPKFDNVNQSINYVECHDNRTLYDVIKNANFKDNEAKRIIRTINFAILFSYGISFYHSGQEIGLTKYNIDNSYNLGDKYNMFNYETLDNNFDMALYFSSLNKIKKDMVFYKDVSFKKVSANTDFINSINGCLLIKVKELGDYKDLLIVFNPTGSSVNIPLDDYYRVLVTYAGFIGGDKSDALYVRTVFMNPYEVNLLIKKEDNND